MKINFQVNNLLTTLDKVERMQSNLTNSTDKILDKMAEVGKEEAEKGYAFAQSVWDGETEPIEVTTRGTKNTRSIVAKGKDVAFVEFGTGIMKMEHTLQNEVEGIVPHGQYGKGYGANPSGWYYPSSEGYSHTMGNDAGECLYNAGKIIQFEAGEIISEVLND